MDRETSWTSGYVTELEYTYGYYRELSPGLLRLACISAGVAPPSTKHLRYLELGFGQGLSVNIHAAAVDGEFWGTDFNPSQVTLARALAEASGSGAKLFEDSFAEFAARPDLPEFDIIGLHGIWTWISDENSRVIVDLIRRKLRGFVCAAGDRVRCAVLPWQSRRCGAAEKDVGNGPPLPRARILHPRLASHAVFRGGPMA